MIKVTSDMTEFMNAMGVLYVYGADHNGGIIGTYLKRCKIPWEGYIAEDAREDARHYIHGDIHVLKPETLKTHKNTVIKIIVSNDEINKAITIFMRIEQLYSLDIFCMVPVYTDFGGRMNPAFDINYMMSYFRRKLLLCQDISIVSNECSAGFMYRWLGINMCSPTISSYITQRDFSKMVDSPREYFSVDIEFDHWVHWLNGNKIPSCRVRDIHVAFPHESKAENAVRKWNSMRKRVNYERILFVYAEDDFIDGEEAVRSLNATKFPSIVFSRGNQFVDRYTSPHITKLILKHGYAHSRELPVEDVIDLLGIINDIYS